MSLADIALTIIVLAAVAALAVAVTALVRVPDPFVKIHAMSKAVILGPLLLLSSTLLTGDIDLMLRAALVGGFLFVTAPVAAHAIVRWLWTRGAKSGDGTRDGRTPTG